MTAGVRPGQILDRTFRTAPHPAKVTVHSVMTDIYAEGGNYRIELDAGVACCRVWARPDLDSAAGARFALEKVGHFEALSLGAARGMIFDLSAAPPVAGPSTQESLGQMLATWERAKRPIAMVGGSNQIQLLQLRRLVASHAPSYGSLFTELPAARAWIVGFGTVSRA